MTEDLKVLVDSLHSYYVSRGCEDDAKHITRIIMENGDIEKFQSIIAHKNRLPKVISLIESNNIYKLFGRLLSHDTLIELAGEKPSQSTIARGNFEILCQLLIKDLNRGNKRYPGKHGDINAGGITIELKGPKGRIKGQKEHSASLIDNEFNRICGGTGKDVFASISNMKSNLSGIKGSDSVIFDIISRSLQAQYGLNEDISVLQPHIVNRGCINYRNVTRLMGCIQLRGYWLDERWDYICIFKGTDGPSSLKDGGYVCISSSDASDVVKMFNDKRITFSGGGNSSRTSRDHYCKISYK